MSVDPHACWVDAWAFERLLGQAEARLEALRPGRGVGGVEPSDLPGLVAKATALYQGPLLPGDEAHAWTASCRERLRAKFLRLMLRWGEQLEGLGHWKEAVDCYQRVQEVDDLAEEVYQRLMLCYQRLGLRAEAVMTYRRYRQILSSVLGLAPSPKTEAIYRSLTRDE